MSPKGRGSEHGDSCCADRSRIRREAWLQAPAALTGSPGSGRSSQLPRPLTASTPCGSRSFGLDTRSHGEVRAFDRPPRGRPDQGGRHVHDHRPAARHRVAIEQLAEAGVSRMSRPELAAGSGPASSARPPTTRLAAPSTSSSSCTRKTRASGSRPHERFRGAPRGARRLRGLRRLDDQRAAHVVIRPRAPAGARGRLRALHITGARRRDLATARAAREHLGRRVAAPDQLHRARRSYEHSVRHPPRRLTYESRRGLVASRTAT